MGTETKTKYELELQTETTMKSLKKVFIVVCLLGAVCAALALCIRYKGNLGSLDKSDPEKLLHVDTTCMVMIAWFSGWLCFLAVDATLRGDVTCCETDHPNWDHCKRASQRVR